MNRYERPILEAIGHLHSINIGCCEAESLEEISSLKTYLQMRLDTWARSSSRNPSVFDMIVETLLVAVLKESQ